MPPWDRQLLLDRRDLWLLSGRRDLWGRWGLLGRLLLLDLSLPRDRWDLSGLPDQWDLLPGRLGLWDR